MVNVLSHFSPLLTALFSELMKQLNQFSVLLVVRPSVTKMNLFHFVVRPPPGFECKSPSSHMSSLDDPSILWSKRLEPGQYQTF